MGELADALRGIAPRLSIEVGRRRKGFMGAVLHHYLPQSWTVQSPSDAATLSVGIDGIVAVRDGTDPSADVVIRGPQAKLVAALTQGHGADVRRTDFEIELRTRKGRTTFEFLRERFGF